MFTVGNIVCKFKVKGAEVTLRADKGSYSINGSNQISEKAGSEITSSDCQRPAARLWWQQELRFQLAQ